MDRTLNVDDALLPFGLAMPIGDDEIATHFEALLDGREASDAWLPVQFQDDEIDRHLEAGDLIFAPFMTRRRRTPTRH